MAKGGSFLVAAVAGATHASWIAEREVHEETAVMEEAVLSGRH